MARKETWEIVKKYFRPDSKIDKWGDPDAISDTHLLRLYNFRVYIGCPIYVTAGVKTSGHKQKSFHYRETDNAGNVVREPCATDIVIPDYKETPFDLVLDATRFGFTGIGYYPHWQYAGVTVGGLHLDSRPLGKGIKGEPNYAHARWMGVLGEQGQQRYIAMSFENMLEYSRYAQDTGIGTKLH